MNKIRILHVFTALLIAILFPCTSVSGFNIGKKFLIPVEAPPKIFPSALEEKQYRLSELEEEKKLFQESINQSTAELKTTTDDIKSQLDAVSESLKMDSEDDFLNKKHLLLSEIYQTIKGIQQSQEQIIPILDEHTHLLQDYVKDPTLKEYKKNITAMSRDTYSLEDLQNLTQQIVDKEKNIAQLLEQEKNADIEIESRKRTAHAAADAAKKKQEEQQKIEPTDVSGAAFDLGAQQKIQLLKLEEQRYLYTSERDTLRLTEIEYRKALLKTRIFIERLQLDALKEALSRVKPAIKVSEADVASARDELLKKHQQSLDKIEKLQQDIEQISAEIKGKEKEIQEASARFGISTGTDLDDWTKKPKDTVEGITAFLFMSNLNDALLLLKSTKELLEAHIAYEQEKIQAETYYIDIKNSYHKITTRKFSSEEETTLERKKYETPKSEVCAMLARFKEKNALVQERLDHQKKALSNIKNVRQKVQSKKNSVFKNNMDEYATALELLNSAETKVHDQIEQLVKMQEVYNALIAGLTETAKHIDFIISELELTTIWQRSKYAITWEGFQNIIPNLEMFFKDIRSYIKTVNMRSALASIPGYPADSKDFMFLVVYLLLFIGIVFAIRFIFPKIAAGFEYIGTHYRGLRIFGYFVALVITFISDHIVGILVWLFITIVIHLRAPIDPYPYILLYLCSIPYLMYLAYRFIHYFEKRNRIHHYIFISKEFQRRFILVVSTLLYATIGIFLLREAFLLSEYDRSELPKILLAINFIVFQIALIFLIAKEQILSIIPNTTEMWRWIAVQVDRFYYLFLMFIIIIIIMSNPYVGFGKLVADRLYRLIGTILLVRVVLWCNTLLRRALSYVFFSRGQEFVRERFAYGKSLYGILATGLFLLSVIIICILGAKLWGWPEAFANINSWADIDAWLRTPIILGGTDNPISIFVLLKILFYVVMGFFIAFIIESFILDKIFDVMLVDSGIQNTISSLTRYVILIFTAIITLQSIGFGELVWPLMTALLVGIGWVAKEPLGDFIAYFIILVQRPVKIGDYIRMDDDTFGVVRKITPRSVVVRRRNSTTIILPNTLVISKPLMNWNYVRGFVAFDDILITISYKEDPAKVKAILLKVMEDNPFVLKNPNPIVRLQDFTETGFVFMARGFLSSNYTLDIWDIASDVRFAIVHELRKNGIAIAIPTRVLVNTAKEGTGSAGVREQHENVPLKD